VIRFLAALLCALVLATAAPAAAADKNVKLTLDGRPVDRAGGVALARGGVVYANLVDLVKSFDGLLTFHGSGALVSVHGVTVSFTAGSRTAKIGEGAQTMKGQTFLRNGDLYVPLEFFITQVARAKVKIDPALTKADISVDPNPLH
jgi:hypothetical protein